MSDALKEVVLRCDRCWRRHPSETAPALAHAVKLHRGWRLRRVERISREAYRRRLEHSPDDAATVERQQAAKVDGSGRAKITVFREVDKRGVELSCPRVPSHRLQSSTATILRAARDAAAAGRRELHL